MMDQIQALRLTCRAGAAVSLRGASSLESVWSQSAGAIPATPIQAPAMHFVPPHEMSDVGGGKNVYNQARCLNQNSPQRSKVSHSAKCEMAGDQTSPLLLHAIAKVRATPQRPAREARLIHECAKSRPRCGRARQSPVRSRVHMIAATSPGADNGPNHPPIFRQAEIDDARR